MSEAPSRQARATDDQALRRLGTVATAYLALLAAIATWAPFELAWPKRFALDFQLRADDLRLNLLMLLPLGFAWGLGARGRDRSGRRGLLLGLSLSLCIEAVQLFLPVRRANPFDVLANAAGAWFGAWAYAAVRPWVDARVLAVLRARPPLAALPIALWPAFWLDGLALFTPARGGLVMLLAAAGACAAASTWSDRAYGLGLRARVALWYSIGALPALFVSPSARLTTFAAGLACALLASNREGLAPAQLRDPFGERVALRRCVPLLLAYLIAVALWSPPLRHAPSWTLGFLPFEQTSQMMMLAFLEYLGAFTLLGYLHSLLGRQAPPLCPADLGRAAGYARFAPIAALAFALALGLELLRSAVFGGCASGTAIALLVVAAVSGACLHDAQRGVVLAPAPAPAPDALPLPARPASG